jgi:hypothetical protein
MADLHNLQSPLTFTEEHMINRHERPAGMQLKLADSEPGCHVQHRQIGESFDLATNHTRTTVLESDWVVLTALRGTLQRRRLIKSSGGD